MELLKGKAIEAKLKSVVRSALKLQENIHLLLCSALAHVIEHGDVCYLNRIMESLPDGQRHKAIAQWIRTFGPLNVDGDGDVKLIPVDKRAERKAPDFNLDEAIKTPYYVLNKRDKEFKPMNMEAVVKSLDSRRTRDAEHGVTHSVAEIAKLRKFVNDWYNSQKAAENGKQAA